MCLNVVSLNPDKSLVFVLLTASSSSNSGVSSRFKVKYRKETGEEGDRGSEQEKEKRRETERDRGEDVGMWGKKKEDKLSAADGILLCPPGLQSGCLATAAA